MSLAPCRPRSWYDPSELYEEHEPETDPEMESLAETPEGEELTRITPWQAMEDERAEIAAAYAWERHIAERATA